MNGKWNLNSLYPGFNSQQFMADSASLMRLSLELSELEPRLTAGSPPEQTIRTYLEKLEAFEGLYQKLYSYAAFRFSAATNDGEAAQSMVRFREIYASTARVRVAFSAFLNAPEAKQLVEEGAFGDYTYYLKNQIHCQNHSLSLKGEAVLSALEVTGSQAWAGLYAKAVAAKDQDENTAHTAAAALNAIKGESLAVCRLRGYTSPLEEALDKYHFDPRILENQMAAVEQYLPELQDYFRIKAQALGYADGLPYDERERLILGADRRFEMDDAKTLILDAFGAFSPRMEGFARRFFEAGWIDSEVRAWKEVGASCDAVWLAKESRIRMAYRGTVGDVNSLAHELGHGYHFENLFGQSLLNCRYDLPVAEVASKFAEMLFKEQLRKTLPEEDRLFCEEFMLSSCINTIVDISARFYFEQALFACRKNAELSVEDLDELMRQAQQRSYGDALDPRGHNTRTWMTKPHYYNAQRNFYNFPYQFGTLLSVQMLERWHQDPMGFAKDYDRFLSATGQYDVLDLCKILDMDLLDPDFFRAPLRILTRHLDRFRQELPL